MEPNLGTSLSEYVDELYEIRQEKKRIVAREKELASLIMKRDGEPVSGLYGYTIVTTADRVHINYVKFDDAVTSGVIAADLRDELTVHEVDKDAFMAAVDGGRITDEGVRSCCKISRGSTSVRVKESK